jgi:hypothetical protein
VIGLYVVTAVRILVSLPLVVVGSILIEKLLLRMKYRIPEVQEAHK